MFSENSSFLLERSWVKTHQILVFGPGSATGKPGALVPRNVAEAKGAMDFASSPWPKPWEHHGKTMGKWWENGGFPWDLMGVTRNGND